MVMFEKEVSHSFGLVAQLLLILLLGRIYKLCLVQVS